MLQSFCSHDAASFVSRTNALSSRGKDNQGEEEESFISLKGCHWKEKAELFCQEREREREALCILVSRYAEKMHATAGSFGEKKARASLLFTFIRADEDVRQSA